MGLSIQWIPVSAVGVFLIMVITMTIFYVNDDTFDFPALPTVSVLGEIWPNHRIFAVCLGVISCILCSMGLFLADYMTQNHGSITGGIFPFSLFTGFMLTLTGIFNFGEFPQIHNVVAAVAFVSLLVMTIWVLVDDKRTQSGSYIGIRTVGVVVGGLATGCMILNTALGSKTTFRTSLTAIFEYILLACIVSLMGAFYFPFKTLDCNLEFDASESMRSNDLDVELNDSFSQ